MEHQIFFCCGVFIHWRAKQTPSNKLGGEIFISLRTCMFVTIYMVYIRPDNQYHAHSHCVRTLTLIPDIAQRKPNTESVRERDCTQRFLSKINIRYNSYQQELLYFSAYNKDVASNKVATLRSVQSRIDNIILFCVIGEHKKSTAAKSVDQPSITF